MIRFATCPTPLKAHVRVALLDMSPDIFVLSIHELSSPARRPGVSANTYFCLAKGALFQYEHSIILLQQQLLVHVLYSVLHQPIPAGSVLHQPIPAGVPGGLVGRPRACQHQFRGFKSHRVHARSWLFLAKKKNDWRKARDRELATFDENRRAVGMLNSMRYKTTKARTGGKKGGHL